MRKITLELSEEEYRHIIRFLEKLRYDDQKNRRRSRWIRQGGYMIDPRTGRKLDTATNQFVE